MKQVLVVDDSAVIRKVARSLLESLNFRTAEAEDAEQALSDCERSMPDMILLDWNMPRMDGVVFLRSLRNLPNGKRPKVVCCTAENDPGRMAEAVRAGADGYVLKPFDQRMMRAKLETLGLV